MIKIEFETPKTAFEVREPFIAVGRSVAEELGFFATFHQPQQRALSGHPGERNRKRIGNAKHKDWYIDYQEEEPSAARPTVIGRVVLASVTLPEVMRFGGFDYGVYGQEAPTYDFVTVDIPTVPHHYRPIVPTPEMIGMTYERLQSAYAPNQE